MGRLERIINMAKTQSSPLIRYLTIHNKKITKSGKLFPIQLINQALGDFNNYVSTHKDKSPDNMKSADKNYIINYRIN